MSERVLYLVGAGLADVRDLTVRALRTLARADLVLVDTYTSVYELRERELRRLLRALGHDPPEIRPCSREELEERFFEVVGEAERVAVLSPGDPMVATTHATLAVEAARRGWSVRIVPGVSILTAGPGRAGLELYRFGRTATIPLRVRSVYPYDVLERNRDADLHTLFLLEAASEREYVSVADAVRYLLELEREEGRGVVSPDDEVIGVLRLGFEDELVVRGTVHEMSGCWDPGPPQALIYPARLRGPEREFLELLVPHVRDARRRGE